MFPYLNLPTNFNCFIPMVFNGNNKTSVQCLISKPFIFKKFIIKTK